MDIVLSILVTLLLTLANGYFSMSELAIVSAKRAVLEPEAEAGDTKASRALELSSDASQFLATIQVAITLVGFASSAVAATSLSDPLAQGMAHLGLSLDIAKVLAPVIITLLVSYVSIVLGELVPKRIALVKAEAVAKSVAGPISAFMTIAKPLVWLTSTSARILSAVVGAGDDALTRENVSEDEIRFMVGDSGLTSEEKEMIHDVLDLGDTVAREVMIPRVDLCAMDEQTPAREVLEVMRQTGYSRIPVYRETVDRVVGIAHIKDLIGPILDESAGDEPIAQCVRQASFVPDTKDIIPLLSEMRIAHEQMVIVVDEYGGTAGIITIEDIVEEIVGEIEDEFDPDNKYISQLSDTSWLVDGRFSIDDARELGWPIEDSEEYETIAGYVLELADKLPRPGDTFTQEGYAFKVQSMRGRRVTQVRVWQVEESE